MYTKEIASGISIDEKKFHFLETNFYDFSSTQYSLRNTIPCFAPLDDRGDRTN